MPQKVIVMVFAKCNCGHPISEAPVEVEPFGSAGNTDSKQYGTTNSMGLYWGFYERPGGRLWDLTGMSGTVIACDEANTFRKDGAPRTSLVAPGCELLINQRPDRGERKGSRRFRQRRVGSTGARSDVPTGAPAHHTGGA